MFTSQSSHSSLMNEFNMLRKHRLNLCLWPRIGTSCQAGSQATSWGRAEDAGPAARGRQGGGAGPSRHRPQGCWVQGQAPELCRPQGQALTPSSSEPCLSPMGPERGLLKSASCRREREAPGLDGAATPLLTELPPPRAPSPAFSQSWGLSSRVPGWRF